MQSFTHIILQTFQTYYTKLFAIRTHNVVLTVKRQELYNMFVLYETKTNVRNVSHIQYIIF